MPRARFLDADSSGRMGTGLFESVFFKNDGLERVPNIKRMLRFGAIRIGFLPIVEESRKTA